MRVICSLYLPARYLLCPQRIVSSNLSYSSNIARLRLSFSVLVHRRIQTIQLGGDLAGGFGPDEGRGSVVVLGDVAVDGILQLDDRAEDAAPEPAPGQRGEEGLDRVQPRARGGREVEGP